MRPRRSSRDRYVPAAGRAGLTALYDPAVALTMRESLLRARLVAQTLAGDPAPRRVLDIGCGTGTLTLALARAAPHAEVVGIDGDESVLRRARAKSAPCERPRFTAALAGELPFGDRSFDRVTASLLLHHLAPAAKREALRVLRPGGRLHVADWGRAQDPLMRVLFLAIQALDGFEPTRDHVAGELPSTIASAGFTGIEVRDRIRTALGSLELLCARRPEAPAA